MARVSDTQDSQDIERGTGSFLLPHTVDQDLSAGNASDKSGSGTDQSSLDPEQPCKPLIVEKYMINGNKGGSINGELKNGHSYKPSTKGGKMNSNRKSLGTKAKICCVVGGATFAAGIVLIVIAVLMINDKILSCQSDNGVQTEALVLPTEVSDNRGSSHSDQQQKQQSGKTVVANASSTSPVVKEAPKTQFTVSVTISTTTQPIVFDNLVNLASGGQAFQSSTFRSEEGVTFPAAAAIDGSENNFIHGNSCAQTNAEEAPMWWIDMGSYQLVKRVRILQPKDCCEGELADFEIRIGQQRDLSMNVLCRDYMGTALSSLVDVQCQRQIYGRYVSIQLLGEGKRLRQLTLCEVAIYDG